MKTFSIIVTFLLHSAFSANFSDNSEEFLSAYSRPSLISGIQLNCENIEWPSEEYRKKTKASGKYIPKNIIPTRFQMDESRVFVTFPRFRPGVPFTLGIASLTTYLASWPQVAPYPDWEMHQEDTPERIVNALDIYLDCNKTLWVLDVGIIDTLESPKPVGKPRILGIDVVSGRSERSIDVTPMMSKKSRLQFITGEFTVEVAILYISDAGARAIIMYDLKNERGSQILLAEEMNCGVSSNVLHMVNVRKSLSDFQLFLSYLDSRFVYSLKTKLLRECNSSGLMDTAGQKNSKIVLLGHDNGPNLYFRYLGDDAIFRWNTHELFVENNFELLERPGTSRLATCIAPGLYELVWILESNFQDYIAGEVGCFGTYNLIRPLVLSDDD